MTKIFWKFCFCPLHFQWWFNFFEKILIWLKKVSSVKKVTISNDESFLEAIFDLKQIGKILLTQTIKFRSLTLKIEEMLWWYTKFQKTNVWRRLGRAKAKTLFAKRIPDKIFLAKQRNSVKLYRSFDIYFCVFLDNYCKTFNFWKWYWALGYVSSQIWDIPSISFYFWWIGSVLKVPQDHDQDCRFKFWCITDAIVLSVDSLG